MSTSRLYKVEAVILKRKNIGEADRMLTIFTKEYGKLVVVAKGIRKITSRRAPHLEVFSQVILMLHKGKTRDILTEASLVDGFQNLRRDLILVNTTYYLCELIDMLLAEKQEHRDVYALLTSSIAALNANHYGHIYYSEQFAITLLHLLGFLPPERTLPSQHIQQFIERITERKMKTYQFLTKS